MMKLWRKLGSIASGIMITICWGHILNGIKDLLIDIYQFHESAKLLRDVLEDNYLAEDASSKKFLVSNFNTYKIVYRRPIFDQFHEL